MKEKSFTTEIKYVSTPNNLISLRTLYMPIIGVNASTMYSLFIDFNVLNKNMRSYDSFATLLDILQVSSVELELCLRKLEAVGLIRTFESADSKKFIITINEPLSPESFRRNSFLYKQAISKIGELTFEKIEFATKETSLNKDDFKEVTAKYQDIFSIEVEVDKQLTTQDIPLIELNNVEEAIVALNSFQFIKYLANDNATPTQNAMVQRLMQTGLSNQSINAIINYVFIVNNKIVSAHIETIANDFISKNIKGYEQIIIELKHAKKAKESSIFDIERVSVDTTIFNKDEDSKLPTWDEIFSTLGGEL